MFKQLGNFTARMKKRTLFAPEDESQTHCLTVQLLTWWI